MPFYLYIWLGINAVAVLVHAALVRETALDSKALTDAGVRNGRKIAARANQRRAHIGLLASLALLGAGAFSALRHLELIAGMVVWFRIGLIVLLVSAAAAMAYNAVADYRTIRAFRRQ